MSVILSLTPTYLICSKVDNVWKEKSQQICYKKTPVILGLGERERCSKHVAVLMFAERTFL